MTTQVETIEDIIEAANHLGWYLVTLCQYGMKGQIVYRATFQHRTLNGATENVFNEYEDAPDAYTAMLNAFERCKFMAKKSEPVKLVKAPVEPNIPPKLEKALAKAIDANWFTRKTVGAPRRVR